MPLKSISFSRMFTYNTCQRKYRYVYIEKIKRPPASKLVFGTSHHKTQEYAYRDLMSKGKRPKVKRQKEYFDAKLKSEWKNGIEFDYGDTKSKLQKDGLEMVETYEKEVAPGIQPIAIEEPFEIKFDNVGWTLVGRMDIVQKHRIDDMKFGKRKIDPTDPKVQLQLGVYRYADSIMNPKSPPKDVGIHSVRRLVRSKPSEVLDVGLRLDNKEVLSNVAETARAIEATEKAGTYPKVYNGQVCSWCQYKDLCGL